VGNGDGLVDLVIKPFMYHVESGLRYFGAKLTNCRQVKWVKVFVKFRLKWFNELMA
jgi:hypothetical protein